MIGVKLHFGNHGPSEARAQRPYNSANMPLGSNRFIFTPCRGGKHEVEKLVISGIRDYDRRYRADGIGQYLRSGSKHARRIARFRRQEVIEGRLGERHRRRCKMCIDFTLSHTETGMRKGSNCAFYYQNANQYYVSDSDSDRGAFLLKRTIKKEG